MEISVDLLMVEKNLSVCQSVNISGKRNVMDFGEEVIVFMVFVVNSDTPKYNGKMKHF